MRNTSYELQHEKTCSYIIGQNKGTDKLSHNQEAEQFLFKGYM